MVEREAVEAVEAAAEQRTGRTIAERHPGWPPVELRLRIGSHERRGHAAGLETELGDGVDIFFYEDMSGDEDTRQQLQAIANTPREDKRPKLKLASPFWHGIADNLHGTGVVVDSFDLVEGDAISGDQIMRSFEERPWRRNPDLEATLDAYADHMKRSAGEQHQREDIMADRYEAKLEQIIERHPELLEQDKIVSLATLGAFHIGLYHDLDQRGESVSQTFSPDFSGQYSHIDELSLDYRFGREPSRDLVARAYVENALDNLGLRYDIENGRQAMFSRQDGEPAELDDYTVYVRALTDRLSLEDIAALHPKLAKISKYPNPWSRKRLVKAIAAKADMGSVPKSARELHERAEQLRQQQSR
jgi:hypothetical protein